VQCLENPSENFCKARNSAGGAPQTEGARKDPAKLNGSALEEDVLYERNDCENDEDKDD
jgi:hypothetical protein